MRWRKRRRRKEKEGELEERREEEENRRAGEFPKRKEGNIALTGSSTQLYACMIFMLLID